MGLFKDDDWTQFKKTTSPSSTSDSSGSSTFSPTLTAIKRSLRLSHLLPAGSFFLESGSGLLLPLPGEEVPPGVEGLVVEEEEGAASQVAEEGWEDANQKELYV